MTKEYKMFDPASAPEDLLKKLSTVPTFTNGRKSEHTERYPICRLLTTLSKTNYLSYPLSLTKRENPDFLLGSNNETIGIEVTEATSEDYSSYIDHIEKNKPDWIIYGNPFSFGKKITREQKNDLLDQDRLTGPPQSRGDSEREWSLYIKDSINKKNNKSSKYKKFNQNWLLIYGNTPVGIKKKDNLFPLLKELWPNDENFFFNQIFIQDRWIEENSNFAKEIIISLSKNKIEYFFVENM